MVRRNDCHGVNNETANQSTFSCASGVERKRSSFAVALFLAGPAASGWSTSVETAPKPVVVAGTKKSIAVMLLAIGLNNSRGS